MAVFANSSISDIVTTTIQSRSGFLADNVTNNNALLMFIKKRGNVKTFDGGNVILQEIMYDDPLYRTAQYYSGFETINIASNSPISAAQFDIKQAVASVVINGLEQLQNAGEEQIIDLLDGRMQIAEAQLYNLLSAGVYSDGTGSGGKQITGLQAAVPNNPSTGTYGGIDRAAQAFWRSVRFAGVADGGSAVSVGNIQNYMNRLVVQLIRGTDKPNCIVADNNFYQLYLNSLQAMQRVMTDGDIEAGAGFASLRYCGAGLSCPVMLDGGIAGSIPANTMYVLNTDYMFWRPHAKRNMVPISGERSSINQDGMAKLIAFAGNLTSSGPRYSGVLIA